MRVGRVLLAILIGAVATFVFALILYALWPGLGDWRIGVAGALGVLCIPRAYLFPSRG